MLCSIRFRSLVFAIAMVAGHPAVCEDITDEAAPGPLQEARELIAEQQFEEAVSFLRLHLDAHASDPDGHNLVAYALHNLGDLAAASEHYAIALEIAPDHLGALEYQGALYLKTDRPGRAKENLQRLLVLCGVNCEQYRDLEEAISEFEKGL